MISRILIKQQNFASSCIVSTNTFPADHRVKLKESEKRDKYPDLVRELKKKLWNMKVTVIPIVIGAIGKMTKGLVLGLEDLEMKGQVKTIQATEIGPNAEKSPGYLRILAVIHTPVENHQLVLV